MINFFNCNYLIKFVLECKIIYRLFEMIVGALTTCRTKYT